MFDRYFVDWYRLVELDPGASEVELRKQAAAAAADSLGISELVGLVELAYGRSTESAREVAEALRTRFQDADPTFRMSGNDLEMSVLAASIAIRIAELGGPRGAVVALAGESARFLGWNSPVPALPDAAHTALAVGSHNARELPEPPRAPGAAALRKAADALTAAPTDASALAEFGKAAAAAVATLSTATASVVAYARSASAIATEQSGILWWLLGRVEGRTLTPWTDVVPEARPLRVAYDLAALTEFVPGPRSVEAIIARVLVEANGSAPAARSIKAFVDATAGDWRAEVASASPEALDSLTPLIATLRIAGSLSSGWATASRKKTGLDTRRLVEHTALASQFYSEQLLSTAYRQMSE